MSPQFFGADGVARQRLTLSTTESYQFFSGPLPENVADMQVSVQGAAFSSDPDYITFEGDRFTLPNPSAFPLGMQLLPGRNQFRVRAILADGSVTQDAIVDALLIQETDVQGALAAPTGISVEREDTTVEIRIEGLPGAILGYHFYASPQPGGGDVGYFRINPQLISSGDTIERESDLSTLTVDATIPVDGQGIPLADPVYFRMQGAQETSSGTVLDIPFNEVMIVPDGTRRFRITTAVRDVVEVERFFFTHDRQGSLSSAHPALPHSALATVPEGSPLYYVATAVYAVDGVEVESHFSPEVVGSPLRMTPKVGSFPQVPRQTIVRQMVSSIYRTHPAVRVDPGSALRDTVLDPMSTEADRIRFLIDFMHNAQSFATLLAIDDPTYTGESIPVSQSAYKIALREAFFLQSDDAAQQIIDNAFDKLASNWGVYRDGGQRSRGEVTFYVTYKPSSSIVKPIGTRVGQSVVFRTTSLATIAPSGGGRGYNPATGRYFARAYIQADVTGSAGNLAAGQIKTILNNTLGVQVVNEGATFGGTDRESNLDIAMRAMRVLSSVDSGTLQGYFAKASRTAGVSQVSVIPAGHPLMVRDLTANGGHAGGKVDIYIRGSSDARVTDTFAFTFNTRRRQQFEPIGDLSALRFRAVDSALSPDNPLIEMLNLPHLNLSFENATKGYEFNLTDARILSHNIIELSPEYNDPIEHDLDDEIRGSYRYRTSSRFVLSQQPVKEILQFEGTRTGVLPTSVYDLFQTEDPLGVGRSSLAGDYVQVTDPLESGVTIPSPDPVQVVGERHTLLDGVEYLDNLGANILTIRVWNFDRSIEYRGPLSTNPQRDFSFVEGTETSPVGIQITDDSRLVEGQSVLVDYYHDENFTVTYISNAVIGLVQNQIASSRHVTADVITKAAVEAPVDIAATIALTRNSSQSAVDSRIRTALTRLFGTFALGTPLRQSDVIRVLDAIEGVAYVVTPLTKLSRSDNCQVVREHVSNDFFHVAAWSTAVVSVYLLLGSLSSPTTHSGGVRTRSRGVYQNSVRLGHEEVVPNINGFPLKGGPGRAFIIGAAGLTIPGYSDDATFEAQYLLPSNPDEKQIEIQRLRQLRTGNRVLVTLPQGMTPTQSYEVTYVVTGDTQVQNITPGPVEYLVLGNIDLTYDAEQA